MSALYSKVEPYEHGMLDVGDGNLIYWETCGDPSGKPALVVHGGPGSGCSPRMRQLFNPERYKIVLFDQRNCGRSRPHASDPVTDLATNTTHNLIADIELLREALGLERWLVFGGSWGSTLSLAYAESHPLRVTEMVLFGVTTGRHSEFDWWFRGGAAAFFPEAWDRLVAAVPPTYRGADVVQAYSGWLNDADPAVRYRAAEEWCTWESATADWPPRTGLMERFTDPDYAFAFARIVTHYVANYAWLEDGILLRNAHTLSGIQGAMVNGRFDFQAPIGNAWELKRVWPEAELVIVDGAGHGGEALNTELVRVTDRFAQVS